jgi:hypothetical protein
MKHKILNEEEGKTLDISMRVKEKMEMIKTNNLDKM